MIVRFEDRAPHTLEQRKAVAQLAQSPRPGEIQCAGECVRVGPRQQGQL